MMRSILFMAILLLGTSIAIGQDISTKAAVESNPIRDGRASLVLLFGLSVLAGVWAIDLSFRLRSERQVPTDLADEMEKECQALRLSEALRLAEGPAGASILGRAVHGGLARTRRPNATHEAVQRAAESAGSRAVARLDRRTDWLAALSAVAPLLGLLGTVQGLTHGCAALVERGDAARAADLAAVVASSLGPAMWGILIGLVAGIAVAWLRQRLDGLADEAARRAELILEPVGRTT